MNKREMKYKVEDKVKYIGKRNKQIMNQIGVVSATKLDNWPGIKLRCDEYLIDFGFEDDCEYVIREPQLASAVLAVEGEIENEL